MNSLVIRKIRDFRISWQKYYNVNNGREAQSEKVCASLHS